LQDAFILKADLNGVFVGVVVNCDEEGLFFALGLDIFDQPEILKRLYELTFTSNQACSIVAFYSQLTF
jgi:hypothetical protein